VAAVDGIYGTIPTKSPRAGRQLQAANSGINMVYFLASGIDIADDRASPVSSRARPDVTIFGATSATT